VQDSDLIVHVVDASHPDPAQQIKTVRDVIGEAGARDIPELIVFNKSDLIDDDQRLVLRGLAHDAIFASARTGEGIDELLVEIARRLPKPDVELELLIPYDRGDVVFGLHNRAVILSTEYDEGGTRIRALVRESDVPGLAVFSTRS
jgi:GTP-binding protein HflX